MSRKILHQVTSGPADFIRETSGGVVTYDWPAQAADLLAGGTHDLILSIG